MPNCLLQKINSPFNQCNSRVTGLLRTMGSISRMGGTVLRESPTSCSHSLPYQLAGSQFISGWEITSELGKLAPSAHYQIRKIWRSPHLNLVSLEPEPIQRPLAWEELMGFLFLPSTDIPVWSKNFNTWTQDNYISILLLQEIWGPQNPQVTTKILNPKWPTYLMGSRKKQNSSLTEDNADPESWLY